MLLCLLLTGCAATIERVTDSWVGEPIDSVVLRWGVPQGQMKMSDGKTVYEWVSGRNVIVPIGTYSSAQVTSTTPRSATVQGYSTGGAIDAQYQCTRQLLADQRGIVLSGSWRGNGCCNMSVEWSCEDLVNPRRK